MAAADDYGPVAGDDESDDFAHLLSASFGIGIDVARQWLGPQVSDARVIRFDSRVICGLLLLPMGQFYGGRRVSMCSVAGLGVAPAARGRGVATALMGHALRELKAREIALSTLYPATYPLYRRAGYELAGGHYRIRVPASAIGVNDRGLAVRPIERTDTRAIERLYRRHAVTRTGWLDRSAYVWRRVRHNLIGPSVHGHLVEGPEGPEGYVFLRPEPVPLERCYDLVVHDLVSMSARAGRRLLGFLADHRSQARDVVWHGGVDDPHVYLMPERGAELSLVEPWMLRIVDPVHALQDRGYARQLSFRLDIDLKDEVLPANSGRYRVDIEAGRAAVKPGGRGSIMLDVGALASLYSGYASPYQLATGGRVVASASALERLAVAFAGPPPSLPDSF